MTLILDNDAVVASTDVPAMIDALEDGLRAEAAGGVDTVPRINLAAGGEFFRLMPVVIPGMDIMGFKVFNGSIAQGVRYVIGLYRASSGELLSLMDASYLTAARTGATTGLATRLVTPEHDVSVVGVIGSGLEARTNLEAICAVRAVREVKVFSRDADRRARFAEEMGERLQLEVRPVASGAEAADAEAVLVATNTGMNTGRVALEADWLPSAAHVSTIGSTMPALREVDAEVFARADVVVVDTEHARNESGDLIAAVEGGQWSDDKLRLLHELPGTDTPVTGALTVFKSVGTATQDIIAAAATYETARERGLGRDVDFLDLKVF
jgi:ornithine cyclodeaminase/alanine dehydrogenase